MRNEFSAVELAQLLGVSPSDIDEWRSLDLIGTETAATFGPEDVQRVRVIQLLLRRGIGLDAIVRADKEERVLARCMTLMFPGGVGPISTLSEAARRTGLAPDTARRFWQAIGLAEQGELLDDEDVGALANLKVALDAGLPEEAALQLVHVCSDALRRVTEAAARLFHIYVHERLKIEGLSGPTLFEIGRMSAERAAPLMEPTILYFHHKGWQRALREDAVSHVREHAGLSEKTDVPGQLSAAIMFIDLTGFTSLAETMGDEMAARVLERFSQIVRDAVGQFDGHLVKQMGDAFMLVFPEARSAVECAVEVDRLISGEPQFPAVRTGVHYGQLLYREGDYLGTSVNIAARLAAEAERHQVLVTAAVRHASGTVPDLEFLPLGRRRLRGLAEETELFAAVPRRAITAAPRSIDPVCGMELGAEEAAATLSFEGEQRVFCSQSCLQRFVAAPQLYGAGASHS